MSGELSNFKNAKFPWKGIWYQCLVCQKMFENQSGLMKHKDATTCGARYPALEKRKIPAAEREAEKRKKVSKASATPIPSDVDSTSLYDMFDHYEEVSVSSNSSTSYYSIGAKSSSEGSPGNPTDVKVKIENDICEENLGDGRSVLDTKEKTPEEKPIPKGAKKTRKGAGKGSKGKGSKRK